MTEMDIMMALDGVDPKLLAEAEKVRHTRRRRGAFGALAAACMGIGVLLLTIMLQQPNTEGKIVASYPSKNETEACYAYPEAGEYFCEIPVNEARAAYAGKNVSFLLRFFISDANYNSLEGTTLAEEYQRLTDLGYRLYYVEDHWTYYGAGQKTYVPIVVGLFTEAELANFQADSRYGYIFCFAQNGDGSAISVDGVEAVTDFDSIHS